MGLWEPLEILFDRAPTGFLSSVDFTFCKNIVCTRKSAILLKNSSMEVNNENFGHSYKTSMSSKELINNFNEFEFSKKKKIEFN